MSVFARQIVDRMKRSLGRYVKFPYPPNGSPEYWNLVYKSLGPTDVFEWGNFRFQDLNQYKYEIHPSTIDFQSTSEGDKGLSTGQAECSDSSAKVTLTTTLSETLGVYPLSASEAGSPTQPNEPVVILGCGNSKFGEDLVHSGYIGPIIQVDFSSRVIDTMSYRCADLVRSGDMQFVQDDVTELSLLKNDCISVAFDKGLADSLYCAGEFQMCHEMMRAAHRVLKPNGVVCVLSLSHPEFILDKLLFTNQMTTTKNTVEYLNQNKQQQKLQQERNKIWSEIEVRKLTNLFLYRFVKADPGTFRLGPNVSRRNHSLVKKKKTSLA